MNYDIVMVPIDQIVPAENNPRIITQRAISGVAASIEDVGFLQNPVLWPNPRRNNQLEIIVGHTRYFAARQLGYTELPCMIASDLTEEQAKRYRVIDNKSGELAKWDLKRLWEEFQKTGTEHNVFKKNFTDFEIDSILKNDWFSDFQGRTGNPQSNDPTRCRLVIECRQEDKTPIRAIILGILKDFEGATVS